jgi:hypothetical protein
MENKYIKYKNKYINLKKKYIGGSSSTLRKLKSCNEIRYKNRGNY